MTERIKCAVSNGKMRMIRPAAAFRAIAGSAAALRAFGRITMSDFALSVR